MVGGRVQPGHSHAVSDNDPPGAMLYNIAHVEAEEEVGCEDDACE